MDVLTSPPELTPTQAGQLAIDFLLADLDVPEEDRDYFSILSARPSGVDWYVVEIGLDGLPDKWVLQVYNSGDCDPCYTFVSPMPATEDVDLAEFPTKIAEIIAAERRGDRL